MHKSIHFLGQPLFSRVINLLKKEKVLQISRSQNGKRYIKRFDAWTHPVVMLYGVIMRFDSLREITASLQAEARKLRHLGIFMMTSRSTLSDANKRRPEEIFAAIYRDLYATYHKQLLSDSRPHGGKEPAWMKHLRFFDKRWRSLIIDLLMIPIYNMGSYDDTVCFITQPRNLTKEIILIVPFDTIFIITFFHSWE